MGKGKIGLFVVLLIIYLFLLALDLAANLILGWIPWMGAVLETLTESVIEVIQLIVVVVIGLMSATDKGGF